MMIRVRYGIVRELGVTINAAPMTRNMVDFWTTTKEIIENRIINDGVNFRRNI